MTVSAGDPMPYGLKANGHLLEALMGLAGWARLRFARASEPVPLLVAHLLLISDHRLSNATQ